MSKTSSEIIIDGIVEQIKTLKKKYVLIDTLKSYKQILEDNLNRAGYNKAIDDVINLLKKQRCPYCNNTLAFAEQDDGGGICTDCRNNKVWEK